jgi:hypothetical protein
MTRMTTPGSSLPSRKKTDCGVILRRWQVFAARPRLSGDGDQLILDSLRFSSSVLSLQR